VTQETTGLDGRLADALKQRIQLAEAVCELIAAHTKGPGTLPHQQILEAWQRWRSFAAPMSEWQPVVPVAPRGAKGRELLRRLELAERPILALQFVWTADYQKEYETDWQALLESVADWQAGRDRE